jgi:hypothetical protein
MKVLLNIIISMSYIYSSSLLLSGYGGDNTMIDPAASGLGYSVLFSGRPDGIVQSAMSTQYNSPLSKIHISNNYNQLSILNTANSDHHISSIGFSFPFKKSYHISIGLSPKTRTDFSITPPQFEFISGSENVDPLAVKHSYDFSGGISNLYFGFSSGYFDKFDFGFKWDILFGNLFSDATTSTYTFNYDSENCIPNSDGSYANDACINTTSNSSSLSKSTYNFNGHSFTIDGRSAFNLHELATSITVNAPLNVTKSILNNFLLGEDVLESTDDFSIGQFSCGYKFEKPSGIGTIIELQRNLSAYNSLTNKLFETNEPVATSLHGGAFRRFENTRIGFWNSLMLRGGFMLKQIIFDDYSVQDNAVTIGLGLKFLNNTNEVDISLSSGIRKTENEIYPDEKYINVNFGISSGDTWFKAIRRK